MYVNENEWSFVRSLSLLHPLFRFHTTNEDDVESASTETMTILWWTRICYQFMFFGGKINLMINGTNEVISGCFLLPSIHFWQRFRSRTLTLMSVAAILHFCYVKIGPRKMTIHISPANMLFIDFFVLFFGTKFLRRCHRININTNMINICQWNLFDRNQKF